jgi:hypothetical protein
MFGAHDHTKMGTLVAVPVYGVTATTGPLQMVFRLPLWCAMVSSRGTDGGS